MSEITKQERYKKADGMDKIDEWARDKTHEQFRTIMWAMCEKYESRLGKKDAIVKEVGKMADYMNRWHLYEKKWDDESTDTIPRTDAMPIDAEYYEPESELFYKLVNGEPHNWVCDNHWIPTLTQSIYWPKAKKIK